MSSFDLGPIRGMRPEERPDSQPDFGTMYSQYVEDARRAQNDQALMGSMVDAYDSINDRIKAATGTELTNPFRANAPTAYDRGAGAPGFAGAIKALDPHAEWKRQIDELRGRHADALPWDDVLSEPERAALARMKEVRDATNKMSQAAGLADPKEGMLGGIPILGSVAAFGRNIVTNPTATAAQVLGGLRGSLYSAPDAVSNVLGFSLPGAAAKSLIKNATLNALSNAGVQAILSGGKQEDYRKAGLPYGWKVWLEEVEGAAATGFALDLAVRAPARGIISRFGRDTPADTMLSRNTERGGLFLDAVTDATPTPRPREQLQIDPETIKRAEAGDVAASREILQKTGALEDPAVRYAVDHMEAGGKLSEDALRVLDSMGVARADGMRVLADAMAGRMPESFPEPIRAAPEPLQREQGAALMERLDRAELRLENLPPQLAQVVQDGLEAGIPRIVKAVQEAANSGPETFPAKLSEALDARTVAEARIHGGRAGPLEIAQSIRDFPDIIDENVNVEHGPIATGRTIAGMEDAAYAEVARGAVPSEVAVMIAERVPREVQARMVMDLEQAKPGSIVEAADIIEALMPPRVPPGAVEPRTGSPIDDPAGPAAKAQVEALKGEAGQAYVDAMAPIARRDELESQIETLRGQLAKQEMETARGEGQPDQSAEATSFRSEVKPKDAEGDGTSPAEQTAAMRQQLDALERELAQLQAELDPSPDGQVLARLAMRAVDMRRQQDIAAAVNDALRLGQQLTPIGTRIDVMPDESMIQRAANGETFMTDATSVMQTGSIQLAMSAMDPAARMGHEAVHTLVTMGHLSPAEVSALSSLAREAGTFKSEARYRKAYEGRADLDRVIEEEAAASYIEARIRGDVQGPANTIVERVRQLIERVRQMLAGYGFQSREDVVQAIMSGDAARRQARADWARNAQTQGRAEMRAAAERGVTLPDGTQIQGVPLFAIRAYHGSPHDFDRFDISKIGTGEGAQAYGHGLYFAENEGVARWYRDTLEGKHNQGKATWIPSGIVERELGRFRGGGDEAAARSGARSSIQSQLDALTGQMSMLQRMQYRMSNPKTPWEKGSKEWQARQLERSLDLVDSHPIEKAWGGRMYEVNIKANPEDFLDWDKPLSQQSEKVQAALSKEFGDVVGSPNWHEGYPGARVWDSLIGAYDTTALGAKPRDATTKAQQALRDAGIPGIRYLDQGSRGAGEGSRNYVVFDDALIDITHKDGQPVRMPDDGQKLFSIRDGGFGLIDPDERPGLNTLMSRMRRSGLKTSKAYEAAVPVERIQNLQPDDEIQLNRVARYAADPAPRDVNVNPETGLLMYRDGDVYYLADGHHRVAAARQRGDATIDARVRDIVDPDDGQQLAALRDEGAEPEPTLKADMAKVDRMNRIGELIAACRA